MKLTDKYPNLDQFFGCHFHQDWDYDYATTAEAVRHFCELQPKEEIIRTIAELKVLLHEVTSDEALGQVLYDFGSCYIARYKGRTAPQWQSNREWLTKEVLAILEAHLAENRARSA